MFVNHSFSYSLLKTVLVFPFVDNHAVLCKTQCAVYHFQILCISDILTELKIKFKLKAKANNLQDTDNSQYFAITEFNNNIIVLSFDHQVCFHILFLNYSLTAQGSNLPFSPESMVSLCMSRNYIIIICSRSHLGGTTIFRSGNGHQLLS